MKKLLLALPLGLALTVVSQASFAFTGTINFQGRIDSVTCPIEVIDPVTGAPGGPILIGYNYTKDFPTVGSESVGKTFQLKLTPGGGCTVPPGSTAATVTFSSVHGGVGPGNELYGLKPLTGVAEGIAVAIKDNMGALIPNGAASKQYPISITDPSTMAFHVVYKSYLPAANIAAGPAEADVNFTVNII
ncbi:MULTISPECIES: fimbrial protein [Pseudomonas]|jgi:major type 1 subunit fimbrin (pilin)|uniref:fimbrial protein n=1 Tax=Pseudomonas TaxID=286 RepID=UPI00200A9516|nr:MULTISPECIES: fimbrial protein [Pseudomonas]MCK8655617.1 fimbrial protein [Pseudomonas umsongensis]